MAPGLALQMRIKRRDRKIQQMVGILQIMLLQPVTVFFLQQREVMELVTEIAPQIFVCHQRAKAARAELVLLQFRKLPGNFLGKSHAAGAAAQQFQFTVVLP